MLKERYTQIVTVCEQMAETAGDIQISRQLRHTRQLLEQEHLPTIALVGMGPTGRSLLDAAAAICRMEMPDSIREAFAAGPACLTLENGERETLCRVGAEGNVQIANAGVRGENAGAVDELLCTIPCDRLHSRRLLLCGGVEGHDAWVRLLENTDAVILRLNATSAMNQTERSWIDNELLPLYGRQRIAVWVDLLDQLNTEEDRNDVMENIQKALGKRELDTPVFSAVGEAEGWAAGELERTDVWDQHVRKALKICLSTIQSRIDEIRSLGAVDEEIMAKARRQLESQRSRLELAGEVAADTTVANAYAKMKIDAKAGVRDFNLQAVASICSKIDEASLEELETLEPKIQAYLRGVWERYQQELNEKLEEESQKCYALLMERMEKDAGSMLDQLDEDTRRVMQAAMGGSGAQQGGTVVRPNWEYQGSNSLTKLKTETRNLMLLSIPLAFASPVLSLALIFGVRHYRKTQTEKRGDDFRDALKDQVKASCEETVEEICREVDRTFDSAGGQMAASVREAYNGLTDTLIRQLQELYEQQRGLMARIDALHQMQSVTIPSLICSL